MKLRVYLLLGVAVLSLPGITLGQADFDRSAEDEKVLQSHGLKTDGPSLLAYFKERTFPEADPKRLTALIKDLGDESFVVREDAFDALMKLGNSALVALKQAESDGNAERRVRATYLRERIEAKAEPEVQAATARLIGEKRPSGAVDVLLAYLPFAADDQVVDEVCKSLAEVAKGAKGNELQNIQAKLAEAIQEEHALKRAAAAQALATDTNKLDEIRKLLKDPSPEVRLRVGLTLAYQKDRQALPTLVNLLGELGPERLWPVEEMLVRLAGDEVPPVSLGTNEVTRKECRDAWQSWLDKNKDIDLAKLSQPRAVLGYTLVVMQNINRIVNGRRIPPKGEVMELDGAKKPRWKFEVPTYPVDAEIVGPNRVVVAEYQGGRISMRDFKGDVKWEKAVGANPIGVQALPNGNIFVVTQNRLLEFDRNQKQVYTFQRNNHDIFRAQKLRNGDIVFITNAGALTRMESKTNRVIRNFQVGNVPILFGSIDVLPNGGVIVPDFQRNRVVEYSPDGKEVRQFNVQWPNSAMRLPNGNTLVASQNTRRVTEFNPAGQEVWVFTTNGMVFNARKR